MVKSIRFLSFLVIPLFQFACGNSSFNANSAAVENNNKPVYSSDGKLDSLKPKDVDGDGKIDPPTVEAINALLTLCKDSADKLQTKTQAVNYPERKECKWRASPTDTSNPNLERKDRFNQASETSSKTLELPEGVICDINIKSPTTAQLHYDDFIILNLNQKVLFSSNRGLTEYLEKTGSIYAWDWKRVVGKPIQNFEADTYCLGAKEECKLPGHDQMGPVAIDLKSASIAPIALTLIDQKTAALDLVATGDNDNEDCFHSALDVSVEFKFLAK